MNKVLILLGLTAIILATSTSTSAAGIRGRPTKPPRPTTTVRPPPEIIQPEGCGGVLEGSSGLIQYKIGVLKIPNGIICVWTIRSPNSGQLFVNLDSDTFSGDSNSYISILNVGQEAVLQKSHKILSGDRGTYAVDGQVAYVIFRASSTATAESGFQLYFRGDAASEDDSRWTGGNKTHVHFHYSRSQGAAEEFSYPDPRRSYLPDEFGSWVLNPEHPKMINRLSLYYLDFEDFNCQDYVNIHQIDGDSPVLLDKKCNTNTYSSARYETVREPYIVTFNSNYQNQRTGFIMYYSNDRDRWDQDRP